MNPWGTVFTWLWFTDDDLFRHTPADFDKKARALYEDGVQIAILFSPTHFRWSFRPYWDRIDRTMREIVTACHRYGIRVVEHHSARLTFGPENEDDWEYTERFIGKKGSSISSWDGWREYLVKEDILENGTSLHSFRQIDGRTGKWSRSNYHGWSMCFNNPDFQKEYFSYLETVYLTGVDGIMTDDVQFDINSCACEHCRKLFYEETGFTLPSPDRWNEFMDNYDDPAFIAFKRFRINSTERFQRAVNRHFESLGLSLLRPNYISDIIYSNWSSYPFETCADLWDYIFQENLVSSIIGQSHLTYLPEALHRFSMGRARGVPSMSHFYPDTQSEMYLAWALSKGYGQIYLGSSIGASQSEWEKPYRLFEKKHAFAYTNPEKRCDIAFYFSTDTRDYTQNGASFMRRMVSRMQGAYLMNIQTDLVFPDASLELLKKMPCLYLADTVMLSDEEIAKLQKYLSEGGKIIIEGECGTLKSGGSRRAENAAELLKKCGDVIHVPKGDTFTQEGAYIHPYENIVPSVPAPENRTACLMKSAEKCILPHLKTRRIKADAASGISASFFSVKGAYVVHLINTGGLISEKGTTLTRNTVYRNFDENAPGIREEIRLTIAKPDNRPVLSAAGASPEFENERSLSFTDENELVRVTVPANTFSGYLLIIIKTTEEN